MNRDRNRERRIHSARHWRLHDRIRYAKKIEQTAVSPHKLAPICRKNSKASFHCDNSQYTNLSFVGGACPLYPQKRTLELGRGMSALCQKRTLCSAANSSLFDRFIGAGEPRL